MAVVAFRNRSQATRKAVMQKSPAGRRGLGRLRSKATGRVTPPGSTRRRP